MKVLVLITLSLNGYIGSPLPGLLILLTIEHRMVMFVVFVLGTNSTHIPTKYRTPLKKIDIIKVICLMR